MVVDSSGIAKLDISALDLAHHMRESVMITSAQGVIVGVNPAFTDVTGYTSKEVVGKNPRILKSGRQGPDFYKAMWASLQTTGCWQGEIWNRRKNGEIYPEWLTITTIRGRRGEVLHFLAVFTDITRRKLSESRLIHLAMYDPLTLLPNRSLFRDRLEQALAQAHRDARTVGVMFLDIDYFKDINDSLGHLEGDKLLAVVAGRLRDCMREGDTVARIGGDEFAVILSCVDHNDNVLKIAAKILAEVAKPISLKAGDIFITVSLGIALCPQDGRDAPILLQKADEAMYKAKKLGRNNYQFFGAELEG